MAIEMTQKAFDRFVDRQLKIRKGVCRKCQERSTDGHTFVMGDRWQCDVIFHCASCFRKTRERWAQYEADGTLVTIGESA